ncbi:MAG: hypothetical protein ACE5E0_02190 [Terriglobia bacterium]
MEPKDFKKFCLLCPVSLIADFVPSKSEAFAHLRESKKEMLLVFRSLIDEAIEHLERDAESQKSKKIDVD